MNPMQPQTQPYRQPSSVILNRLADIGPGVDPSHDREEVLTALKEGRDIPERAVDVIVDRLLKELSW